MNILTYFTDKGIPKTGLSPLVKIVEVETSAIIASWVSMDEISDGWYKYNFDTYDYTKEYVVICDGGALLGQASRYIASAVDNSNLNMSKIVLNAQSSNHQEPGSIGEMISSTDDKIKRALGLLHENIYIDLPIYDENNNLVSSRVRIYSNNTSVGTDDDVIGTYLISSDGSGLGKFTNWSQVKL